MGARDTARLSCDPAPANDEAATSSHALTSPQAMADNAVPHVHQRRRYHPPTTTMSTSSSIVTPAAIALAASPDAGASPAVGRLPNELLLAILRNGVAPVSPPSYKERYRQLIIYARVSKTWHHVAQLELHRHVVLRTLGHAERWLRLVANGSALTKSWSFNTLSLTIGLPDQYHPPVTTTVSSWIDSSNILFRLIQRAPGLKELRAHGCDLDPAELSWAAELRQVHLSQCALTLKRDFIEGRATRSTTTWYLPQLQHLALHRCWSDIEDPGDAKRLTDKTEENEEDQLITEQMLFNPLSLPKLSSLAVSYSPGRSEPELDQLAPQLRSLWLSRTPLASDRSSHRIIWPDLPELSRLIKLEHLAIDIFGGGRRLDDEIEAIRRLVELNSETLRSLRINSYWSWLVELPLLHNVSSSSMHALRLGPQFKTVMLPRLPALLTGAGSAAIHGLASHHRSQQQTHAQNQLLASEQKQLIREQTKLELLRRGLELIEFVPSSAWTDDEDDLDIDPDFDGWIAWVTKQLQVQ